MHAHRMCAAKKKQRNFCTNVGRTQKKEKNIDMPTFISVVTHVVGDYHIGLLHKSTDIQFKITSACNISV